MLHTRPNVRAYLLWFLLGTIVWLLYHPFEQPIEGDRAYLVYMAQAVGRGQNLYHDTPLGYTPLGPLVGGTAIALVKAVLPQASSITILRLVGFMGYLGLVASVFGLGLRLFQQRWQAHLLTLLFLGLAYPSVMATVNFESKLLGMLFTLWGCWALLARRWFWAGVFAALALLCWQIFGMVGLVFGLFLLFTRQYRALAPMAGGAALGMLVLVGYLYFSNAWVPFWEQTLLRKVMEEGEVLGESPWLWPYRAWFPYFVTDSAAVASMVLGLFVAVGRYLRRTTTPDTFFASREAKLLMVLGTLCWTCWNSLEFQSSADLIPSLIFYLVWGTYLLHLIYPSIKALWAQRLFWGVLVAVSFWDVVGYRPAFTYSEEKALISELTKQYEAVFTVEFEPYFVLQELPMPTKFVRVSPYENVLLSLDANRCPDYRAQLMQLPMEALIIKTAASGKYVMAGCAIPALRQRINENKRRVINFPKEKVLHPWFEPGTNKLIIFPVKKSRRFPAP